MMYTGGGGESFGVFDMRVPTSGDLDSTRGLSPTLSKRIVTAVSSLRILNVKSVSWTYDRIAQFNTFDAYKVLFQ
jgi:hypothetical protein